MSVRVDDYIGIPFCDETIENVYVVGGTEAEALALARSIVVGNPDLYAYEIAACYLRPENALDEHGVAMCPADHPEAMKGWRIEVEDRDA